MENELDERYEGREHSLIKHLFLSEYLKAAAFKTLQGKSIVLNYVDGFAGPWRVADGEDYSDSSFDLSIKTVVAVKEALEKKGQRAIVRFCLCERDPERARRLREYACRQVELEIHVFEGSFEDSLNAIASVCRNGFTFTFIDPTGFNLRSLEIAQFLAARQGDFLFNFMSEHINRYPAVESVKQAFGALLADTNWKARFDTLRADLKNEERILILFKERMKELGAARHMPDFEILNPRVNRLQMRLVLGTHHPAGVEVFRDVQAKVEKAQDEIRERIRNPQQPWLFAAPPINRVGDEVATAVARNLIHELVSSASAIEFQELAARILENSSVRLPDLKALLMEMRSAGDVAFDLAAGKRKPDRGTIVRSL